MLTRMMGDNAGNNAGAETGSELMVNELLCFVTNKMHLLAPKMIVQLCSTTYSDAEIEAAKEQLFGLCADDTTTRKIKRQGPEKGKRNLEDIIQLLDEKAENMPRFVALDLSKLPPITFDSIDVSSLLDEIQKMRTEIQYLKKSVGGVTEATKTITESMNGLQNRVTRVEKSSSASYDTAFPSLASSGNSQENADDHTQKKRSYAMQVTDGIGIQKNVKPVQEKRVKTKSRGVVGAATNNDSEGIMPKTIQRRMRFANVFATRFDADVTEDQVLRYLKKRLPDIDLNVQAVSTKYKTYTSYHITSYCPDPSVFMDCNLWPKNAFVRWWRENRKDTKSQGLANLDDDSKPTLAADDNSRETTGSESLEDDGIARESDDHNTNLKVT